MSASITVVNKNHIVSTLSPTALQDILHGVLYAVVSITGDDHADFSRFGKANPWHLEALKLVTGSKERALGKLNDILQEDLGLQMDHFFNCSRVAPGGHCIDLQGYIAHNDSTIVLSYRCSTSLSHWMANFDATTSAWEIEEDVRQGHSGRFSGLTDSFGAKRKKPKVHTGYYNNFLASVPAITEHIKPLLEPNAPPRKLFIVGHSLGAGIATLATCYFLQEFQWDALPHSLVSVTMGGPRACHQSMIDSIQNRLLDLGQNVAVYRLVNGKDIVTKLPPKIMGLQHLGTKVRIMTQGSSKGSSSKSSSSKGSSSKSSSSSSVDATKKTDLHSFTSSSDGDDDEDDDQDTVDPARIAKFLSWKFPNRGAVCEMQSRDSSADDDESDPVEETYEEKVARLPIPFRDHMPDVYLKALLDICGLKNGSIRGRDNTPPPVVLLPTVTAT